MRDEFLVGFLRGHAETLKIVGGGILGFALGLLAEIIKHRFKRRERLAGYLITIAGALEGMAQEFEHSRIPSMHGHILDGSIGELSRYRKLFLGSGLPYKVRRLSHLAKKARVIHGFVTSMNSLESAEKFELTTWIRSARGLAGDLQAEAAKQKLK